MNFYDTNILLHKNLQELNTPFLISNISLQEIQNIKISANKDGQIKYRARNASRWLKENLDSFQVIIFDDKERIRVPFDFSTNDKKIIFSALQAQKNNKNINENIIFKTSDLNCYLLAKNFISSQLIQQNQNDNYNGYINIYCNTEEELSNLYEKMFSNQFTLPNLVPNEYILIYNQNKIIDKYKYTGNKFETVPFYAINSKMFGKIKPLDVYQQLLINSFKTNQMTLVKGSAGTGKSLLSMAYLFSLLEQGKINKIIIFCNTVATAGSARLGFYPGDRTEKLLDSQIGNFLISKLGARQHVERLIDQEQLLLLPMSDIRGFDTSGMQAGIYITQAQNLTIDLLKLALQRVGENSICILDGDNETQVDLSLYAGNNNGLKRASEVFRGQDFYGEITLQKIHRSKIAEIANKM